VSNPPSYLVPWERRHSHSSNGVWDGSEQDREAIMTGGWSWFYALLFQYLNIQEEAVKLPCPTGITTGRTTCKELEEQGNRLLWHCWRWEDQVSQYVSDAEVCYADDVLLTGKSKYLKEFQASVQQGLLINPNKIQGPTHHVKVFRSDLVDSQCSIPPTESKLLGNWKHSTLSLTSSIHQHHLNGAPTNRLC
jgi:hypothetical protein